MSEFPKWLRSASATISPRRKFQLSIVFAKRERVFKGASLAMERFDFIPMIQPV